MEENLFRVGGVYRQNNGELRRLAAVSEGEVVGMQPLIAKLFAGTVPVVAQYLDAPNEWGDGWRRLSDGKYHADLINDASESHLIPGELHQVDGQWVSVEESKPHFNNDVPAGFWDFKFVQTGPKTIKIRKPTRYIVHGVDLGHESHHAKMLRKDAEGFAAAKPFVKPAIPQKLVQGPHAPIDGLTQVSGFSHLLGAGVR